MSGFEPSAGPASRKGRRRDLEELLPGGRALPREAAESAEPLPSSAAAQRCQQVAEQPPTRPPPAPRGASLTGENGLAAAAQRQPREGQDGGEGGGFHGQRPPVRTALAGGSPSAAGAETVTGGRDEREVREAQALQHVSCNCAPARCRVADEGSYYQPCDRKG